MDRPKRKRAESRAGMVVTTIALAEEVHRRLSIAALDRRTVLTELVRQAVAEWLDRNDKTSTDRRAGARRGKPK